MLYFVTENKEKLQNAKIILEKHTISIEGKKLPLLEIQSDTLEEIALYKAQEAFKKIQQPLVVKDDGWYITALRGFPGVYMKYINEWLTVEDFLQLIQPYANREIIFKESVCYISSHSHYKIFTNSIKGRILPQAKGKGVSASARIATFKNNGKSMAECVNEGIHFTDNQESVWNEFAKWYKDAKLAF